MISWARLPTGTVFHAYDVKYPYARAYRSVCGKWQPYYKVDRDEPIGRRCKGCVIEMKRHQKRPAPV